MYRWRNPPPSALHACTVGGGGCWTWIFQCCEGLPVWGGYKNYSIFDLFSHVLQSPCQSFPKSTTPKIKTVLHVFEWKMPSLVKFDFSRPGCKKNNCMYRWRNPPPSALHACTVGGGGCWTWIFQCCEGLPVWGGYKNYSIFDLFSHVLQSPCQSFLKSTTPKIKTVLHVFEWKMPSLVKFDFSRPGSKKTIVCIDGATPLLLHCMLAL